MGDMINRKHLLDFLDLAEHDAEERDWRDGANEIARIRKYVAALPPADDAVEALVKAAEAVICQADRMLIPDDAEYAALRAALAAIRGGAK